MPGNNGITGNVFVMDDPVSTPADVPVPTTYADLTTNVTSSATRIFGRSLFNSLYGGTAPADPAARAAEEDAMLKKWERTRIRQGRKQKESFLENPVKVRYETRNFLSEEELDDDDDAPVMPAALAEWLLAQTYPEDTQLYWGRGPYLHWKVEERASDEEIAAAEKWLLDNPEPEEPAIVHKPGKPFTPDELEALDF